MKDTYFFFVTGTSTGVGKTVVSFLLCKFFLERGMKTIYFKPVQTGAIKDTDENFIKRKLKKFNLFFSKTEFLFKRPVSPHFAARLENKRVSLKTIKKRLKEIKKEFDVIIVEGAGGVAVPVNQKGDLLVDIFSNLKPITVIAGKGGLGALNHFIITESFCRKKRLNVKYFILISSKEKPSFIEIDNKKTLKRLYPYIKVVLIPRMKNFNKLFKIFKKEIGDIK